MKAMISLLILSLCTSPLFAGKNFLVKHVEKDSRLLKLAKRSSQRNLTEEEQEEINDRVVATGMRMLDSSINKRRTVTQKVLRRPPTAQQYTMGCCDCFYQLVKSVIEMVKESHDE